VAQDVAAACGVRAMPTFQAFFGGEKVGELQGASPPQLEALIKE
jgi:thioredoxin 1